MSSVLRKVQNRNLASKYVLIYVPNNDKFRDMLNMFLCMGCSLVSSAYRICWSLTRNQEGEGKNRETMYAEF